jgi:putative glycosyltransferase (TIGR04348 family)
MATSERGVKISLITPVSKQPRAGNQVTARRWGRLLRELGHEVRIARVYRDEPADLMIALHAWRSAASIERFRTQHPEAPLVVALTGTDIYRYAESDAATTFRSLGLADALVGLHDLVRDSLPREYQGKLTIIRQSATALARRPPLQRVFEILVIGHLREEKDPLRAAAAARLLPASSRIRIVHLGGAYNRQWDKRARREMAENPRYRWLGDVPGHAVRRALARASLMVLSSITEGGANVLSEAIVAGVPILASAIPGSIGLLGRDYRGYFPVGDTASLARLMRRAENDPAFRDALERHCAKRLPLFAPDRERQAWRGLLARLVPAGRAAEA